MASRKDKAEEAQQNAVYQAALGQMGVEDLIRQLCLQLQLQRQATERVAQALDKVGGGNLLGKALQHFAPRGR